MYNNSPVLRKSNNKHKRADSLTVMLTLILVLVCTGHESLFFTCNCTMATTITLLFARNQAIISEDEDSMPMALHLLGSRVGNYDV
jgi:hypothetical protein